MSSPGAQLLAVTFVRDANDLHVGNGGVLVQELFDLS